MEQDVRKYWNQEAEEHARTAYQFYEKPKEVRYPFFEVRMDRLLEILDELKIARILDAGCGSGEILLECLKRGWEAHGCDIAEKMLALAEKQIAAAGFPTDRLVQTSITGMPMYADASFDAVICPGVLEYLNDAEEAQAFSEFKRILKPNGTLIVENVNALFDLTTFNRFTLSFFKERFFSKFFKDEAQIRSATNMLSELITYPDKPDRSGKYSTTRDQVFNRTEIPFEYTLKVRRFGFEETKQVFYRFHAVPPLFFEKRPDLERISIEFERQYSTHWIGYFLATGFISVLKKR
jgi:ubiquinone/menaquinone biosynthesis C-methylase UbiE